MSNFRPIIEAQYVLNTAPLGTIKNLAANTIVSNLTGGSAAPVANTLAAVAAALINDSGSTSSDIWSASKIQTQIDAAIVGLDFQADVLDVQIDATLDPGASPTTGDRYIITNSASLNANFGTITGVADGDIVEYDGANFVVQYDVSVQGEGALAWDRNSNTWQQWNGTSWSEFGGLSGVTAGDGLSKSANTLNVGAGNGISVAADTVAALADTTGGANLATVIDVNANGIAVKIDSSTISENGSNQLYVPAQGITETELNTSVAGTGLTGGNGTPLALTGDVVRWTYTNVTGTGTATSGTHAYVSATATAYTYNLPASPDANTIVQVFLADDTNTLTVSGNGNNVAIGTTGTTLDLTIAGEMVTFRYSTDDSTYYWF
jgi:hypothetical protein